VPAAAVKEMRGKKLARAAPILALAAFNKYSADIISGRRSKMSEFRPAETSLSSPMSSRPAGKNSWGMVVPAKRFSVF